MNFFMQRPAADLSRLPPIPDSMEEEQKLLKENGTDRCSNVTSTDKKFKDNQIIVRRGESLTEHSHFFQFASHFHVYVTVAYINCLLINIESVISDVAVKLLDFFF